MRWEEVSFLSCSQLTHVWQVHILNESRGSTLEVVISRMKFRGTSVRFVMVSATVPNIHDVAAWIGNGSKGGPAIVKEVGMTARKHRHPELACFSSARSTDHAGWLDTWSRYTGRKKQTIINFNEPLISNSTVYYRRTR